MTATATPPSNRTQARPGGGPGAGAASAPAGSPRRPTLRLPAELSLWVVTAAAAFSFNRLFIDNSYLAPVLLTALLSHALAAFLRRRQVPVALAAVASLLAMVLVLTWVFYFFTTRAGLPGMLTWDTFTADLREAVEMFRDEQAPVDPVRGFVAGSAVGFWLVAFLGDWSAFRLWAPVEATIPAGSLFVFASLLGADRSRVVVTALFFLAAVGFLLLHRVARLEMSPSWVRGDGGRGARAQLAVGGGITAVALVGVALVGPFLPGATSDPWLDVKDIGNDSDTRVTVSPLVDIKQRLVDQRETIVFNVVSPVHSYWRLTALDEFDGRTWRSSKRFEKVTGALPQAESTSADVEIVEQRFTVSNLSQIWLPAAYEPQEVDDLDREVRWEPTTSTLIVDRETSDGLEYTVTSAVPNFTAEELRAAEGRIPEAISSDFLRLPRNFPNEVDDLARQIVDAAGADTAYDRAMALQDYFRTNYTYSTEVTGGQNIAAIEDFLFSEIKAGYCEQFAGSFAAMARSLGLPARVAVGFTLGDPDPEEPDTYVVKGRHSHAWPEVYLPDVGWVLFEPTPGRGSPNASYTNTVETQDSDIAPNGSTTTTAPTTTVEGSDIIFEELPTGGVGSAGDPDFAPSDAGDGGNVIDSTGAKIVLAVLAAMAAYAIGVPVTRRVQRLRRRQRNREPSARIDVAWREATEALRLIGIQQAVGETPNEFAVRADNRSRAGTQVRELASLTTAARYSPEPATDRDVSRAQVLAQGVGKAVIDQTTAGERLQAELDPRPALRRWWHLVAKEARTDGETEEKRPQLVGSGKD